MHTYDKYNFWQIKLEDLPSRGLFYPEDATIKIRSLTVLEVKFLATLMPQTATGVCNELLEKCVILKNMDFKDLVLPDRQFLIFWMRLNSFPLQNGFKITLPACLECGTPIEHEIKLEELVFTYLDDFIPFVHLDDENCDLIISIPKYNDSVIDTKDEIGDVAIYIDNMVDIKSLIKESDAMNVSTVTTDDINQLRCPGKVWINPTRTAEFFDIDFTITEAGVTFNNTVGEGE